MTEPKDWNTAKKFMNKRIMVLDDDEQIRQSLLKLLRT